MRTRRRSQWSPCPRRTLRACGGARGAGRGEERSEAASAGGLAGGGGRHVGWGTFPSSSLCRQPVHLSLHLSISLPLSLSLSLFLSLRYFSLSLPLSMFLSALLSFSVSLAGHSLGLLLELARRGRAGRIQPPASTAHACECARTSLASTPPPLPPSARAAPEAASPLPLCSPMHSCAASSQPPHTTCAHMQAHTPPPPDSTRVRSRTTARSSASRATPV